MLYYYFIGQTRFLENIYFTHNVARTGLVFYNESCRSPTNELGITVGSHAFLQLQRKTSHMVFISCVLCFQIILA